MVRIYWADRARAELERLPPEVQDEIRRQLSFVEMWPEMFPQMQDHPRWRTHRKIVILRRWIVLYRFQRQTDENGQVYILDIVPARSNY